MGYLPQILLLGVGRENHQLPRPWTQGCHKTPSVELVAVPVQKRRMVQTSRAQLPKFSYHHYHHCHDFDHDFDHDFPTIFLTGHLWCQHPRHPRHPPGFVAEDFPDGLLVHVHLPTLHPLRLDGRKKGMTGQWLSFSAIPKEFWW